MEAGHHVILACRSTGRCTAAKADLDSRGLAGSCQCASLDLADYGSIRRFAETALLTGHSPSVSGSSGSRDESTQRPSGSGAAADGAAAAAGSQRIAVLVNNAAVMAGEDMLRPNHFGSFLLTRLLLPHMARGGRVVNVASEAHRRGSLELRADGSLGPQPSNWYPAYAGTKLANLLFTAELSRRLQACGSSVTAYGVSPGRVATNIFASVPGPLRGPLEWLARLTFQTPAQGARGVLRAALAPELRGRHELYSHKGAAAMPSAAARDLALAAALWTLSCRETALSPADDDALWPPV